MPKKDSLYDSLKALLFDHVNKIPLSEQLSAAENVVDETHEQQLFSAPTAKAFRVYSQQECAKLTISSRSFLLYSLQLGLISPLEHEKIIDSLLSSKEHALTLDELKWVLIETKGAELTVNQLNFLDFILFPAEESVH